MKIKVRLHPNSSKEEIKKISYNNLEVWVREKPINDKANIRVVKLLTKLFKRPAVIISGFKSKVKIIEIK